MDADEIVATQGQCLQSGYNSPRRFGYYIRPRFVQELTYHLDLLNEREYSRRSIYGDEANDSRLGHTPPETRARYDTDEHNSTRLFMEHMVPPTPKDSPADLQSAKNVSQLLSHGSRSKDQNDAIAQGAHSTEASEKTATPAASRRKAELPSAMIERRKQSRIDAVEKEYAEIVRCVQEVEALEALLNKENDPGRKAGEQEKTVGARERERAGKRGRTRKKNPLQDQSLSELEYTSHSLYRHEAEDLRLVHTLPTTRVYCDTEEYNDNRRCLENAGSSAATVSESNASTVIATQGRHLESKYSSPDRFGFYIDPTFVEDLTYSLRLLSELQPHRHRIYGDEADDSRLGHTPPETRARYNSEEHNKIRIRMEAQFPTTPKTFPDSTLPQDVRTKDATTKPAAPRCRTRPQKPVSGPPRKQKSAKEEHAELLLWAQKMKELEALLKR